MNASNYPYSRDAIVRVAATPDQVFAHLDDQKRLGSHMETRSTMMMGGRMRYRFDEMEGRDVGSVITMDGDVLGFRLYVEEIVTIREPPRLKVWETRGQPNTMIMGAYRMGFELTPSGDGSLLRVFIDWNHLKTVAGGLLSFLFSSFYA